MFYKKNKCIYRGNMGYCLMRDCYCPNVVEIKLNCYVGEKMIETNIGMIPEGDYKDIKAMEYGFNDYDDLVKQGYSYDL